MASYQFKKSYLNHFGIDLKASDLTRQEQFSSGMLNAQYRKSGAIEKRKGYQGDGESVGGFGLFTYNRVDPTTGVVTPIEVNIGSDPYKRTVTNLNITYSGLDPTCIISIFYDVDTSVYRCQILEGQVLVVDEDLGVGVDEVTPYTISSLSTFINGVASFAATVTGDGTVPAAFLQTTRNYDLSASGNPLDVTATDWVLINTTVATPMSGSNTHKNDPDFENVTAVQLQNVLYLTNGYDYPQKYDGQTFYRIGLPETTITHALGGAGAITGNNYYHKAQYIQIDAAGNLIEGNVATTSGALNPVAQSMDVTVDNIVAGTGFNTNCAIVDGAQVAVNTITVDDGSGGSHTIQVGDTAYFYDSVSASYLERLVTAIAPTTITVAGAAVTVADNAVISNNLRIAIYRNPTSATIPSIFYLLEEVPNNSFSATQVYNDNITDAGLGPLLIPPATDRFTPQKAKYISIFRNQLMLAGDIENPYTLYWSDVESPEYFARDGSQQADIENKTGDIISGISQNNEVFIIGTNRSIDVMSGDLAEGNIRIDKLTTDIGIAAHATIQEARGKLHFWSDRGPYVMTGGQVPTPLGESPDGGGRVEPVLDQDGVSNDKYLVIKRAISINDRVNEKYVTFIPAESEGGGDNYANQFSKVYAYDYARDAWLEWNNMNWMGGVTISGNDMYWVEIRFSTALSVVTNYTYRRHNLNDAYDYNDNNVAIDFLYGSNWEAYGEPSLIKTYTRLKIFSLEELANNNLFLTVDAEYNYIRDLTTSSFTFEFDNNGYGVGPYSTSPYGDPSEPTKYHKLGTDRTRAIRFIFSNEMQQQNVILTGWELEGIASYQPEFKP